MQEVVSKTMASAATHLASLFIAFLTSGASLKVQGLRAGKPQHGPRKDEGLSTPWIPTTYARAPATMAPVTFTRRPENPFIDGA
jgi:hypothetical protein